MLKRLICNPCQTLFPMCKLSSTSFLLTDSLQIHKQHFPKKKCVYKPIYDFDTDFINFTKEYFSVDENADVLKIKLDNPLEKFAYLTQCQTKFNKAITNSFLADMQTVEDVMKYLIEPIISRDNLENLSAIKELLPKNLHIQKDPIIFDSRTDTMFGGISAFPHLDRIEVDLEAKKKYPSIESTRTRKIQIRRDDLY